MKYELTGRPIDSAILAPHPLGAVLDLDLDKDEEAALIASGALRAIPEPKPEPEKSDGPRKQDS